VSLPLADGAVTSASIADGAIATADVADAAITQAKLHPTVSVPPPNNTVTSTSIVDGAILAADIATDAVTNEKIAAGAVASGEVLDNSLTSADIATDAVGFAELAANSVGTSENGREVIEVVIADARTTDFIGGYAICPGGKVAVGGGHHVRSWVPSASQDVALTGSEPVTNGWWVALYDPVPYGILEIGVFAVCVNN
jgi:hypothetical protein